MKQTFVADKSGNKLRHWLRILVFALLALALTAVVLMIWVSRIMSPLPPMARHWREMAGFHGAKEYLLIFQNSAELRPTGGFISAIGTLKMFYGLPIGLSVRDSYAIADPQDFFAPPAAIDSLFSDDPEYKGWVFRDANFSPDFPTTVSNMKMFLREAGEKDDYDGVFAVDLNFMEQILALIGPVEVDDVIFDEHSFFDNLQFATKNFDKHNRDDFQTRKDILGELGKRIVRRIVTSPTLYDDLARLMAKSYFEKHIISWFDDVGWQDEFVELGWAGRLGAPEGVLQLALVEANLGGRKSDRYLRRDVENKIELTEKGDLLGTLRIRMEHLGDLGYYSNQFRGDLRAYLPLGAELLTFDGDFPGRPQVTEDLGQTVFSTTVFVDPGEEIDLTYDYRLPTFLLYSDDGLRIKLWKQPGTEADFYRTVVLVPVGMRIDTDQGRNTENIAVWDTFLTTDAEGSFRVLSDERPPLVTQQRFTSTGWDEILIVFDEPIQEVSAERVENYEIWDKDEIDDDATDKVRVVNATYYDRGVTLQVVGISDQPDERYGVRIAEGAILDMSGNELRSDSAELTLVQKVTNF